MSVSARAAVVLAGALLMVGLLTLPAAAHGRGTDATNFRSRVTSAPGAEGLRWRILGFDEQLELRNTGPHRVIVLGHFGEPYVRIDPSGAYENRRSPTVALHRERYATSIPGDAASMPGDAAGSPGDAVSASGDGPSSSTHERHGGFGDASPGGPGATGAAATGAPDWVQVSEEPRWAWHDHRIHWMSPRNPDVAGETVLIPRWEVPVLVDGEPAVIAGELRWIPAPPWPPWLLAGLALTLPALLGLRRLPRAAAAMAAAAHTDVDTALDTATESAGSSGEDLLEPPREDPPKPPDERLPDPPGERLPALPRAALPAAIVLAVVALANVVHLVDDLSGGSALEGRVFAASQTVLYLLLALGGAIRARRGDYAGVTALAIGAGALFLGQGLLYLPVLSASQVGTVAPEWLLRLTVAASLAQALPVGTVVWRATRVLQPEPHDDAPAVPPQQGQATAEPGRT